MSAVKYDTTKLVRYNVDVPNRTTLVLSRVVSWLLIVGSVVYFGLLGWQWMNGRYDRPYYSDVEAPNLIVPLFITIGVLIAGIFLANMTGKTYRKYFVRVRQGYVHDRDSSGGGGYDGASSVMWYLVVYGYTYANELRYYHLYVSAGNWHDVKKGDLVDYR